MTNHHNAAVSRTTSARAWLIEVKPHEYTRELINELHLFMEPLIEHETHLEFSKDVVKDEKAMGHALFIAQLSAISVGGQWKRLKDDVDEACGRRKVFTDIDQFEEEEEEELEEEKTVTSSEESEGAWAKRKALENSPTSLHSDSENELCTSAARRSARLSAASRARILAAAAEKLAAGRCSKAANKKRGGKVKKCRGKGNADVKARPKIQAAWPNQESGPATRAGRPKKKIRNKTDEVASDAEASQAAAALEEPEEEPLKKKPARKRIRVDPTQKPSINAGDID
jgi:hypothetical protein